MASFPADLIPRLRDGRRRRWLDRYRRGDRKRQYRWRLHDLAKLSHVSKTTLANIERGHIPTFKHAVRIAEALDVSVYHLWGPTGTQSGDM